MKKFILDFLFPAAFLLLATALIWLTGTDMKAAKSIYETFHGWSAIESLPWSTLYTYAPFPGLVLAGGALFIFVAGFFEQILRLYRKQAAFLVLMLVLGPGLLVNVIPRTIWCQPETEIVSLRPCLNSFLYDGSLVYLST
jgi:hypothetical protein